MYFTCRDALYDKREHGGIIGLTPSEMFLQTFNRSHTRNNTKQESIAYLLQLSPKNKYISLCRRVSRIAMFQEQKRIDASRICFFFGAGASIKFGIPSMKEMTSTFANELREKGEKEEVEAFGLIYKSLETVYGKDKVDIEAIMSVIHGLKEKGQIKIKRKRNYRCINGIRIKNRGP